MKFNYYCHTSKGPYKENQDSLELSFVNQNDLVACIADGVGGGAFGDLASKYATNKFVSSISDSSESLYKNVLSIHYEIFELSKEKGCEGKMLTTFTGCLITEDKIHGVHCGDSRMYILRGNGIKQLSEDHTEVNMLLKDGKITPEDAINYPRRHILNSALGVVEQPRVDEIEFDLVTKDRVLLTTDGVHGLISKRTLRDMSLESDSIEDFAKAIIRELESIGPHDNYSVIAIEITS